MCNKAYLLANSVRDAGLDGNLPSVDAVLVATNMTVHVGETAIGEEREVTSLCESVTNVWVQNECVSIVIVARNVKTQHVVAVLTVSIANLHCYIELVVELVTYFGKKNEIVRLAKFMLLEWL